MAGSYRVPFVGRAYDDSAHTRRLSDLMGARSQALADSERERAAISAQLASNLGNIASSTAGTLGDLVRNEPRRKYDEARMQSITDDQQRETAIREALKTAPRDPQTGRLTTEATAQAIEKIDPLAAQQFWQHADAEKQKELLTHRDNMDRVMRQVSAVLAADPAERPALYAQQREAAIASGLVKPDQVPETFNEGWLRQQMMAMLPVADQLDQIMKARGESAKPGTFEDYIATVAKEQGVPVAALSAAAKTQARQQWEAAGRPPAEPKSYQVTVPGPDGRPIQRLATAEEMAAGVPAYREPKTQAEEPLVPVIGDDGQPVLMRRSQAEGRRPASNREQGRPVTSGDAGRIAELDTSLDDLNKLGKELGTTGAASKIGAELWNPITEYTGIGAEAKQRQATIDRVKQVIGKALEGGVLRKEDEYKYVKILPTIGDPPEVAATKLKGLEAALLQRRERAIEALADAGYDTSNFGPYQPKQATTTIEEGTERPIPGIPGGVAAFRGGKWVRVK